MLEQLDRIDWKSYGAEYMPALIRGLASQDQKTSGGAYGQLEWILAPWEQGADENYDAFEIQKRLETEVPLLVTPFLIELSEVQNIDAKVAALGLLWDMSYYVHLNLRTELAQKQAYQVFEAVKAGSAIYQALLNHSEWRVKRSAEELIQRLESKA